MNLFRTSFICASAVLGIAAALPALGQTGMGRLFFTPTQRAQLDVARQQNLRAPIATDQPDDAQQLPQDVTVNGMIRRNDGKSTVWVNNKMYTPETTAGGPVDIQARGSNAVTMSLPQSGRSVDLKVGQSVEVLSGQIAEAYQRRSLVVVPADGKGPESSSGGATAPSAGPKTVEKVTAAAPPSAESATKTTEPVERKRKLDDGIPWGMIQSDSK